MKVSSQPGIIDALFGLAYLGLLVGVCGFLAAGIMWFFHSLLGMSAVLIAGIMGVAFGLNGIAAIIQRYSRRGSEWIR